MSSPAARAIPQIDRTTTNAWLKGVVRWIRSWDTPVSIGRAIAVFMLIGVIARACRYLLRFPLWGDECFLAVNFIDRSYAELLQPLDYYQVAPPLFLWIQLTVVKMFGFNEWSLRLFPFACGLGSLFLFRQLAGKLLHGVVLLFAVAIFAVSYYPIRHSVECKPYASDLLVGTALVAIALEWHRSRQGRWLWCLGVATPIAVLLSYPAVFVAGALSPLLGWSIWSTSRSIPRVARNQWWLALGAYNVLLVSSFAALLVLAVNRQFQSYVHDGNLGIFWRTAFPPLTDPLRLVAWLIEIHSSHMFAYPIGGARGASALTLACFIVGCVYWARRGRHWLLGLALGPFALALVAAGMGKYPYGGSTRVALYLAPIICLLTAIGTAALWARIRQEQMRQRVLVAILLFFGAIGVGTTGWDIVFPYKMSHDLRMRDFARWFWVDKAYNAELVCASTDLGADMFPQSYPWRGMAQYLCNQRIYSERHGRGALPNWNKISHERPLRCAVFNAPASNQNAEAFAEWLREMSEHYRLVSREVHDFHKFHDNAPPDRERVELYEFVPRQDASATYRAN